MDPVHLMRILFISAFYPPYEIGGWEQLVQDINLRLQKRGHQTLVLTSNHGAGSNQPAEAGVERILSLESDLIHYRPLDFFFRRQRQIERNLAATRMAIECFEPEVIFVHGMWNLSRRIPWLAERLCPGRVVYYVANDWPYAPNTHELYWLDPARKGRRRIFKKLMKPFALRIVGQEQKTYPLSFEHVLCVSRAIQKDLESKAGIAGHRIRVVYNGVEVDRFIPARTPPERDERSFSLLYAGSVVPHKGVHTAIEAMALLAGKPELNQVSLTVVGSGHPDYEAGLKKLVAREGLQGRVRFQPRVARENMPTLLQKHDVLIFPSIWEEPLARMTQEAMAAGLAVIGTPTGGTPEVLIDGETGLSFLPGDAASLAQRIEQLSIDRELYARLVRNGRARIEQSFDIRRMVAEIEGYLAKVVAEATTKNTAGTSCRRATVERAK
jgi:glycosyltransferase involved in cell wall biosynthesis